MNDDANDEKGRGGDEGEIELRPVGQCDTSRTRRDPKTEIWTDEDESDQRDESEEGYEDEDAFEDEEGEEEHENTRGNKGGNEGYEREDEDEKDEDGDEYEEKEKDE